MEEMRLQTAETENNDLKLILRTALKTLYVMVIFVAFAVIFLFSIIPSLPMKLYSSLGNDAQALRYARMYTAKFKDNKTAGSEYCRGLENVISLSEALFYESGKREYAEVLFEATKEYASLDGIEAYNARKDEYNIENSSAEYRAIVYSNECYIYRLNFQAAINSGKGELFLTRNGLLSLDEILSRASEPSFDYYMECSFLFSQLSELLKSGKENSVTSSQWSKIAELFGDYKDYALNSIDVADNQTADKLTRLYFVRIGGIFCNYACEYFKNTADGEMWSQLEKVNVENENMSLIDYYRSILLKEYINL